MKPVKAVLRDMTYSDNYGRTTVDLSLAVIDSLEGISDLMAGGEVYICNQPEDINYLQLDGQMNKQIVNGTTISSTWPSTPAPIIDMSSVTNKEERKMRNSERKWEFNALHEQLIDFDLIAKELDGETPVAFVVHGETERYVILGNWVLLKAKVLNYKKDMPDYLGEVTRKKYYIYKIKGNFKEWVVWAKKVKSTSWPKTARRHNTVEVSLPKL